MAPWYRRLGGATKFLGGVAVAAALAGCATTALPPIGAGVGPFRPEPDEQGLWEQGAAEGRRLARGARRGDDAALEAYLGGIAARLVPAAARAAGAPAIQVLVRRDPVLNAFALPHGLVVLHSGTLAALETEGQLAVLLAREVAHVVGRHALRAARAAAGTPAGEGGPPAGPLGPGLPLGGRAAAGLGEGLERAADAAALAGVARAGYDPGEAERLYTVLLGQLPERGALERYALGRRPALEARRRSMRRLLREEGGAYAPAAGPGAADALAAHVRVLVRDNALLDARAGRFALARAQADRALRAAPDDPVAHLHAGEVDRLAAQQAPAGERPRLLERARAAYARARALGPALAEPLRQLGLLYFQTGDTERARAAFRDYLARWPDAPDARRIAEYVSALGR